MYMHLDVSAFQKASMHFKIKICSSVRAFSTAPAKRFNRRAIHLIEITFMQILCVSLLCACRVFSFNTAPCHPRHSHIAYIHTTRAPLTIHNFLEHEIKLTSTEKPCEAALRSSPYERLWLAKERKRNHIVGVLFLYSFFFVLLRSILIYANFMQKIFLFRVDLLRQAATID